VFACSFGNRVGKRKKKQKKKRGAYSGVSTEAKPTLKVRSKNPAARRPPWPDSQTTTTAETNKATVCDEPWARSRRFSRVDRRTANVGERRDQLLRFRVNATQAIDSSKLERSESLREQKEEDNTFVYFF
jgi:hypothetical protein